MNEKIKQMILIPARMASTRLPGKPLEDIAGLPMIIQVWKRAMAADVGRVVIACDDDRVADVTKAHGAEVVMTAKEHESGSDRIWEALERIDPYGAIETIVNVQGDLPTIDRATIRASLSPLINNAVDIATLVTKITDEEEKTNPNVVKMIGSPRGQINGVETLRGLYFTRATAPTGEGPLYHHIGLYAYRREALKKFVSLKPSPLEQREKLEQLRALEADMRIDAALVDTVPLGVDTFEDLEKARKMLKQNTFE